MDGFLDEVALKHCKTLDDFNRHFHVWLHECYHTRSHVGLEGKTPDIAYKGAKAPLRFTSPETVASAFLRVERRKVDKSGCIQFGGKRYEVGVLLVGQTVTVAYDPNDTQTLTVEHGAISLQVKELRIGEHTGPRPKLPASMLPALPETSRLLDEKAKRYEARNERVHRALQFRGMKDGEGDV